MRGVDVRDSCSSQIIRIYKSNFATLYSQKGQSNYERFLFLAMPQEQILRNKGWRFGGCKYEASRTGKIH